MINFNMEKNMYDKFIDKDVLTTQELLSLGFTNKDLTSLVQNGKVRRIKKGYYEPVTDKLFQYYKILFKNKDYEKGRRVLKRCYEIEPENPVINTRIMFDALRNEDYEQVFKCLDILSNVDNKFYQRDLNMWLYLLSFLVDVPERYKDRLKNVNYNNMSVLPDDLRFKESKNESKLRHVIARENFYFARQLVNNSRNKINDLITKRLVCSVYSEIGKRKKEAFRLLENEEYHELVEMFEDTNNYPRLTSSERDIYFLVKDLICLEEQKNISTINYCDTDNIHEALENNCYYRARALALSGGGDSYNKDSISNLLIYVLNKIISRIENLGLEKGVVLVSDDSFVEIMSCVMKEDLDGVYSGLDSYLKNINKYQYKEYVVDLIKLSLLDDDKSFEEPLLTLSELGRDVYEYDPDMCCFEFYLNLRRGNYERAAIYLDMVSMSEKISGILVDTTSMREALNTSIKNNALEEDIQKLGLSSCSSLDSSDDQLYYLADIIENVISGDQVAMLEPMGEENIEQVLDLVGNIDNIKAKVIEQEDEKRVVLKYVNKRDGYIPVGDVLHRADVAYKAGLYDDCIDLYESILPKFDEPRGYIYAKLGLSYYKIAENNDFSRAIDYLTLANVQNQKDGNYDYDYTKLINGLKERCGYNGIKLKFDSSSDEVKNDSYKNVEKKIEFNS